VKESRLRRSTGLAGIDLNEILRRRGLGVSRPFCLREGPGLAEKK
jgi:hypothetical protein